MPVPKRKRSRSRRDKRFANKALVAHSVFSCPNCQAPIRSHQACLACGNYKGTKVMRAKSERAVARQKTSKGRASSSNIRSPEANKSSE